MSYLIRGQQLAIDGTATVKKAVEEGTTVDVKVRLGGVQVYHKTFDLCKELGKVGGGCPFKPSRPRMQKSYGIPKSLPKVSLQMDTFQIDNTGFDQMLTKRCLGHLYLQGKCTRLR